MNRLTARERDGLVYCGTAKCLHIDDDVDCYGDCEHERAIWEKLAAYEDTGLEPEEMQELTQAQADGRLVGLPCKIGDIVYSTFHGCIKAAKVRRIMIEFGPETDGSCITHMQVCRVGGACEEFRLSDVGERLFLTREEAKKALEGAEE